MLVTALLQLNYLKASPLPPAPCQLWFLVLSGVIFGTLGGHLKLLWGDFVVTWGHLGSPWATLVDIWGHLESLWDDFVVTWDHLGSPWATLVDI